MIIFTKNILGYCLGGVVIGILWSAFTNNFGFAGGWLSALFLSGTLWFINHYKGLITNRKDAAFVDMGLGVGICLSVKGILLYGTNELIRSMPTFVCISIGAIIAGIITGLLQKKKYLKD